jgi:hypothetical protein
VITVVTPYGRGAGSSRVRVYGWLDHLGLSVPVYDYVGASSAAGLHRRPVAVLRAELALRRVRASRLLLHREASPFSRGGLERRLLRAAGSSVYDFDDALHRDRRRWVGKAATCRAAVAAAGTVIAGNDVLAGWVERRARSVVVIPSCVEPAEYVPKASWVAHDPPRLVWIGSPATEKYLSLVREPLLALHDKLGARLTVLSRGGAPLGELESVVDRREWTVDGFGAALADADVGIGPLDDSPYSRGKCAYKLLQYGATGLPFVASPVGANSRAAELLGGIAAGTPQEWYDGLLHLLTSDREAPGRAAMRAVRAHYSYASWAPTWRAAVGLT